MRPELAIVLGLSAASCLEDLDEPLECPAGPARQGAALGCVAQLAEGSYNESGCIVDANGLGCYRDPAATCACGPSECDDDEPTCQPPPDCPAEVLAAYPGAQCERFAPEDVGLLADEADQCLCGCESCARVCDGKGPIWSQIDLVEAHYGAGPMTFDLQGHLASSGGFGVYVRARGIALSPQPGAEAEPPVVLLFAGDVGDTPETLGRFPAIMSDRFESVIFPAELRSLGASMPDPLALAFYNAQQYFSLYEIDCVVPFVVP
jgi:hypothetical protein